MTEQLRSALAADADTPAGVDLGAVRGRAQSLRRRRATLVAGSAAAVTAAAIVVPAGLLGGGGSGPDTGLAAGSAGTTASLTCPAKRPAAPVNSGAGLDERVVPLDPDDGLLCLYAFAGKSDTEVLSGVLRLSPADARTTVDRLNAARRNFGDLVCTDEYGPTVLLKARSAERAVDVLMESYGCGSIKNGPLTAADKPLVRELADKTAATTSCTAKDNGSPAADPVAPLLPEATTSLVVCPENGDAVTADPETTRSVVTRINAAALPADRQLSCPKPGTVLRLFAVAPDRVVDANVSRECGVLVGGRQSPDDGVVDQLFKLARQR